MIIKRQHDRIMFVIIPAIRGQSVLPSTGARNKTSTHSLLDEIVIFKALDENPNALKRETETEEEEIIDQIDLLDYSSSSDLGDGEDEYSESEDNAPTGASALSNVTGKFLLFNFDMIKTWPWLYFKLFV